MFNEFKKPKAPDWMTRDEKAAFRRCFEDLFDAKKKVSEGEMILAADFILARRRVDKLRQMLQMEQASIDDGDQFETTKNRVVILNRQIDASSKLSHAILQKLNLV